MLGCEGVGPGEVVLGGVEHDHPVAGGTRAAARARRPCRHRQPGSRPRRRAGRARPRPPPAAHRGARPCAASASVRSSSRRASGGSSRALLALAGQVGRGAVEGPQPGQRGLGQLVGQVGEGARRQRLAGVTHRRATGRHVVGGTVEGGQVPAQAGGALGPGEGGNPLEVARPGGLEGLEAGHGPLPAGAQVDQGARAGQRLGRGPLDAGCRVERRHRRAHPGVEPGGDVAQVGADRLGGHLAVARQAGVGEHVVGAGHQRGQRRARGLEVGPGRAPRLRQPGLDVAEGGDVEEPLEHLAAVVGGGAQERGEVALGQQHHLGELGHAHAEGVLDDVGDLVVPRAQGNPAAGAALLEGDGGLHRHHAGTALLRAPELGGAGDAEPSGAGGEVERDARHGIRGGVVAAQAALVARAGDVGVQGEADGVEQARLARPRRPVDEEQPLRREGVDVDDDPVGERPEGLDLEPVHPHAAPAEPASRCEPVATPSSSPT